MAVRFSVFQDVPRADTRSYGIVAASPAGERVEKVSAIVEAEARGSPSTLAVVGRYVLTPRIFHHLESVAPGAGGEIQLTDGVPRCWTEEQVLAYRYDGVRYDCSSRSATYAGSRLFLASAIPRSGRIHLNI